MSTTSPAPSAPQTAHKAYIAAVIAALTTLVASIQGRPELDTLSVVDWLIIVVSAVLAGLTVYAVPNKAKGVAAP